MEIRKEMWSEWNAMQQGSERKGKIITIRSSFLKGLVFIHKNSWLCIYENILLLVHILLLTMMQYDVIGTTYSNRLQVWSFWSSQNGQNLVRI